MLLMYSLDQQVYSKRNGVQGEVSRLSTDILREARPPQLTGEERACPLELTFGIIYSTFVSSELSAGVVRLIQPSSLREIIR